MQIQLEDIGKKYDHHWIIRNANYQFEAQSITGISGKNGSGKSTLLSMISSILTPSQGSIQYKINGIGQERESISTKFSHVAPSIQLVPNLSIEETIDFHFYYQSFIPGLSKSKLLDLVWLTKHRSLLVKELSSGMRQRLCLGVAFCSSVHCILLDEPTSNLDEKGIELFYHLLDQYRNQRTTIIASNEQRDFNSCTSIIDLDSKL